MRNYSLNNILTDEIRKDIELSNVLILLKAKEKFLFFTHPSLPCRYSMGMQISLVCSYLKS